MMAIIGMLPSCVELRVLPALELGFMSGVSVMPQQVDGRPFRFHTLERERWETAPKPVFHDCPVLLRLLLL